MIEARSLLSRLKFVWQSISDFLAAHTIGSIAGLSFLLLVIFLLWPIITVLVKSVVGPDGFTLKYYEIFLSKSYYNRSLFNSLLLAAIVTPMSIGIGFVIAYMTTRGPMYLRTPLKLITLSPLIAPPYMFALGLIILFGHNGIITNAFNLSWSIYGFWGCVLGELLALLPLSYILIESALSSLNPNLEDSAASLGATEGKILHTITIPLLVPTFWKTGLIMSVKLIEAFGVLVLLMGRTLFLAPQIYTMITGQANFEMASVLSVVLILPVLVLFIIQNYLIRGKAYTTIVGKPVASEPRHIDRGILISFLGISFVVSGLILLTFGVVMVGAFMEIVGINNTFTLAHILDFESNASLVNSIKMSSFAGIFGAMFAVILAYIIVRGTFRGRAILEGLSLSGFALPGVVLGIGYLLAFNKPPLILTGTLAIMVLNSIFRHQAVGEEAGVIKLKQLSIEVEEASLNLGAGVVTTFRRIVLPIIFPAFIYGFMYIFVQAMKGLSAMVFLVSPGCLLASVYIFECTNLGRVGLACATTVKLTAIVGICLAILQYSSKWTGLSVTRKG